MKTKAHISILILLLLAAFAVKAQHYKVERINTQNSLPDNSIQAIFKDHRGSMWLGTNSGLCRYDGNRMQIFSSRDGLAGNRIWAINEDKHQRLWLGSYGNGISYYDGKSFHKFALNDSIDKYIRFIAYDRQNDIMLFGCDYGLIVKDAHDSIQYFDASSVGIKRLQVISIKQMGELFYIYTYWKEPTYVYNPKEGKLYKFGKFYNRHFTNIASSIITQGGDTIIGYDRNRTAILKKGRIIKFDNTGQVFDMSRGADNNIWLAGWDITLNGGSGGLQRIHNDSLVDCTDKFQIPSRMIWSLYYDTLEQILFVGTNDQGLFVFKNKKFEYFDFQKNDIDINHLKWVNNSLWVACDNGVYEFKNNSLQHTYDKDYFKSIIKKPSSKITKYFYQNSQQKFMAKYINTDQQGQLYITSDGGFFKYSGNHQFQHKTSLTFGNPFAFYRHKLFTVGWGYLYEYPDLSDLSKIITHNKWREEQSPVDVSKIIEHNDELWFVSYNRGLFILNDKHFKWLNLRNKDLGHEIKDLAFGPDGSLYIGQNNGELIIAQYHNDSLEIKRKLSCNAEIHGHSIRWVVCNKHNQLFVGTDEGLNYLDLSKNQSSQWAFQLYNQKEGYAAFASHNAVEDSLGNIWVDTKKGILKIDAQRFYSANRYQQTRITGISLFNKPADSLLQIQNPMLDYDRNYISFSFARNNYRNADKDVYYYRLVGFDNQWRQSKEQTTTFFNLPHGNYQFEVKTYNYNSNTFSNTAHYGFIIKKAWWTTLWFYGIIIFLIGLSVWFYIRLRIKRISREAERKAEITKQIAELEMQALQAQMNPHFVFNSLNAIQNFVLDGNIDDTLTYLAHFSRLLRDTLNYASEKRISISQEQDFLNHYLALEQTRFGKNNKQAFEVEFIIDKNINTDISIMPPMLLQPIIENAIKHGEVHKQQDGKVQIEFKMEEDFLVVSITDNGIGRERAAAKKCNAHKSKGISIIENRIKLLSQSPKAGVRIIDLEQGVRVELWIEGRG